MAPYRQFRPLQHGERRPLARSPSASRVLTLYRQRSAAGLPPPDVADVVALLGLTGRTAKQRARDLLRALAAGGHLSQVGAATRSKGQQLPTRAYALSAQSDSESTP